MIYLNFYSFDIIEGENGAFTISNYICCFNVIYKGYLMILKISNILDRHTMWYPFYGEM